MAVRIEWRDHIVLVTLDRPERRNAVDHQTLIELQAAQREAVTGKARVLVLTGTEPAFCAGADLTGVESGPFTDLLLEVLQGFGTPDLVTIAAIDGPALGAGTQLAIACDLRVATAVSVFGIPAAKLGLVIDRWTIDRLVALAGQSVARNMLLTASTYRADDAAVAGFVNRLGGRDDAMSWATDIARLAPLASRAHKYALEAGRIDDDFDAMRDQAWASDDAVEGRRAFLDKRAADFQGR
jgi:enoyl-CoA hydratase